MPALLCRGQAAERQFGRIGIGRAVRLVMQVLELAHHREAGLQHLDIELGGNGLEVFRATACRAKPYMTSRQVQKLSAPGPAFSARPSHEALMGVGMHIGHGGNRDAADMLPLLAARRHGGDHAVRHRRQRSTSSCQPSGGQRGWETGTCVLFMAPTILYIQPYTSGFLHAPHQSPGGDHDWRLRPRSRRRGDDRERPYRMGRPGSRGALGICRSTAAAAF